MKSGDRFEVFAPSANWTLHDNTVTGCLRPMVLDSYGSDTSLLRNNLVERGCATNVTRAIEVRGVFKLVGNRITGFDEKGATALALEPDRLGRPCCSVYRDNVFERCAKVLAESVPALWDASSHAGNEFIQCGSQPKETATGNP